MKTQHTPFPWFVGEYDDMGGYDCMYGALQVGPVTLDGSDYGQSSCQDIAPEGLERMKADARLIGAIEDLMVALKNSQQAIRELRIYGAPTALWDDIERSNLAAIAKAAGQT